SRAAPPTVAYDRSREAACRLSHGRLLFRKLDSQLRGSPAADLAGVLDAAGGTCLVAPALPGEGRTTRGGVQRWAGGEAALRGRVRPAAGRVERGDAATDAGLDEVAQRALARGDGVLAGSAGLAEALARALGLGAARPAPPPGCRRPLAIVGSLAAADQAEAA